MPLHMERKLKRKDQSTGPAKRQDSALTFPTNKLLPGPVPPSLLPGLTSPNPGCNAPYRLPPPSPPANPPAPNPPAPIPPRAPAPKLAPAPSPPPGAPSAPIAGAPIPPGAPYPPIVGCPAYPLEAPSTPPIRSNRTSSTRVCQEYLQQVRLAIHLMSAAASSCCSPDVHSRLRVLRHSPIKHVDCSAGVFRCR